MTQLCYKCKKARRVNLISYCQKCHKEANLASYYRRRESFLAKQKEHYLKNREQELVKSREYYRLFEPYKSRMYRNIVGRVNGVPAYKNRKLCFSREEFLSFIEKSIETYRHLYLAWQASGFQRRFAPSVDRVNNDGDYTLDNIQLITQSENVKRLHDYLKQTGYPPHIRKKPILGVTFHKKSGKWQAQISGKYLGLFLTREEAMSAAKLSPDPSIYRCHYCSKSAVTYLEDKPVCQGHSVKEVAVQGLF